jgi:hypothetical protein
LLRFWTNIFPPAGYLNPCALSLSASIMCQSGLCRAVCFVALLIILVENIVGSFGSWLWMGGFFLVLY